MAISLTQTTSVSAQQAKLILQNPLSLDEVQALELRLSQELGLRADSGLDRKTFQATWEALQLKPADVITQNIQLRDANTHAAAAIKQANLARAEMVQVQTKLQELQDTRWQHPVVYTASAAILGLGCFWFFERRKRIAAQEHAEMLLSESHSVLERPEGPPSDAHSFDDSAFLRAKSILQPMPQPTESVVSDQDFFAHIPALVPPKTPFEVAPPWWSRKRRPGAMAKQVPSPVMQSMSPSADPHMEIKLYEGSTEIEDMQAPIVDLYNPVISPESTESTESTGTAASTDQVQSEAASTVSSKDAMAYLLEIRMAVQTFYALEQPHSAHQLLEQHIEAVPNTCAWAYMEYLDISSKLGLRDAFEAMRTRYRLQFNRLAPYWMEPNASVQHLDSYERPMSELCAAWPSQDRSKVLMATWLLGNLHTRRLFQLSAYHDLLDLYEMLEFYDDAFIEAQDFVPTVSLLELDYEFAVEVKLDAEAANDALRAVPTVKPGDFAVDFNLAHNTTQQGAL